MLLRKDSLQIKKTHTDWMWRDGKRYLMQIETKKKNQGSNIISDKIDLKTKKKSKNKGQRKTLHNYKGVKSRRWCNNYRYLCTQHKSTSIYKAFINGHKWKNNSRGF